MSKPGITKILQRTLGFGDLYLVGGYISVGVKDLDRAVAWYCEKLALSRLTEKPCLGEVHLGYQQRENAMIVLFPIPDGRLNVFSGRRPPILYSKNLESTHKEFDCLGISVGPIQSDSGGNRFFHFRDMEGNEIEICVEP